MPQRLLSQFIRKIEAVHKLTDAEIDALRALPTEVADYAKGDQIVREGDRAKHSFLVLSGLTCMLKHSEDGQRQILIFHFPGDVPDLQSLHLEVLDMSVSAASRAKIAFIPHEAIRRVYRSHPRVGELLWRMSLIDAAILREWILSLGQRDAYSRLTHFFCEMVVRMRLAELGDDGMFPFPLTQQEIADAVGLSNIHVNRVYQTMREDKLIELKRGKLIVPNWSRLQRAAAYDMTYLHLTPAQKRLINA